MGLLEELPLELFHMLCLYLKASDLVALKAVCKKFDLWLGTSFWRKRVLSHCAAQFPCISGKTVDWISCAVEREYVVTLFGPKGQNTCSIKKSAVAYGIDAMHIPQDHPDLLLVGDRGRTLTGFSVTELLKNDSLNPVFLDRRTHMGWVWTIKSCKNVVLTGSWDGALRSWAITNTGLELIATYKLRRPVLCCSFIDPNVVVASAYVSVRVLDLRVSPDQQSHAWNLHHRKPILCMDTINEHRTFSSGLTDRHLVELCASGDQPLSSCESFSSLSSITNSECNVAFDPGSGDQTITKDEHISESGAHATLNAAPSPVFSSDNNVLLYTGSDDHFLAGWDLRNSSLPVVKHEFSNYPRMMSLMNNDELWVAEPPNRIHVFDIRHGRLDHIYTNELPGWVRGFGGLEVTPGGVYTCGLHGVVNVFHPTNPIVPMSGKPIAKEIPGSPTCMTYCQGILTVGAGDGSIYTWTSKDRVEPASRDPD